VDETIYRFTPLPFERTGHCMLLVQRLYGFGEFCEDRPTGLEFCMHYWNIFTTLRRPLQEVELGQNPDSHWRR